MRKRIVGILAVVSLSGGAFSMTLGCGEEAAPPLVPSPMPAPPPALPPPPKPIEDPAPPPKPVMADAQKKFLTDFEAALAARDGQKVAALYAPGAVVSSAGKEGVHEAVGRAEIQRTRERGFAVMGKALPDIKWVHTRALQSGNVLIVEWTGAGTDTGGFLDDKPTQKKVGWRGISILQFDDDGLVGRETTVLDPLTIMGQLGRGDVKNKVRAPAAAPSAPTQWLAAKGTPEEQKNLDTAKGLYPLVEKNDAKAIAALMTDDVVRSDLTLPDDAKGKEAAKKDLAARSRTFPDLKVNVTSAWAALDVVIAQVESTGTFKGPLGALEPNGKSGTTHGIDVIDMKDGKIARITSYANARELLVQYDLVPKPAKK